MPYSCLYSLYLLVKYPNTETNFASEILSSTVDIGKNGIKYLFISLNINSTPCIKMGVKIHRDVEAAEQRRSSASASPAFICTHKMKIALLLLG